MPNYDLIVIGAGIAGMTAALGAAKSGVKKILVIERESNVGGIINQCIHNGFGQTLIGESVTGPEYIEFIKNNIEKENVELIVNSDVLDISRDKVVTYVNPNEGVKEVSAAAIILALGAREEYSGNIMISTNLLTGIFTIGEAQRIVNLYGYIPGRNAVITAKDKWGFLLARRLIIEGGTISAVVLEDDFESLENEEIHNIIDGFDIPIVDRARVIGIDGKTRVSSVTLQSLDDESILKKECDCLLLSVSFIPKLRSLKKLNMDIDKDTLGIKVTDYMTSVDGFFACGNIIYGEEIFKMTDVNGIDCGEKAAQYIKNNKYC